MLIIPTTPTLASEKKNKKKSSMIHVRSNTHFNVGTPFKKHQGGAVVVPGGVTFATSSPSTPGNNGGKYRRQQQQHQQMYKANGQVEQSSPSHQLPKVQNQQQQQQQSQKSRFSPYPKSTGNGNNGNQSNQQQQHRHSPYKSEKPAPPPINSESHFAASKFCTSPSPSTIPQPPDEWLSVGRLCWLLNGSSSLLSGLNLMPATPTASNCKGKLILDDLMSKIKPPSPPTLPSPNLSMLPNDPAVLRIETGGQVISTGPHG